MSQSTIAGLLDSLASAPPERVTESYHRLVESVWHSGKATEHASDAVAIILDRLDDPADGRKGYLVLLLGLLTEAEPEGEAARTVRKGLDRYLDLLRRNEGGGPLTLALLYLVGHFPDARDQILASVPRHALDQEDLSRLDRVLQPLHTADVALGRVWPSPAEWTLSEAEREQDRSWIARLSPDQLATTYAGDTLMLHGYSGAKAYWALRGGEIRTVAEADRGGGTAPEIPPPFDTQAFRHHLPSLRCPVCRLGLVVNDEQVRCVDCGSRFSTAHGVLDLTGAVADVEDPDDVLQNAAVLQRIGMYYETVLRPGFLRLMGANWDGRIRPRDEDAYLVERTRPMGGPVLDLAAGAGRWTSVLTEAFGAERVIALDLNKAMLTWLRGQLPGVLAVEASALDLPFGDATLGAVNCWNALQALPDPAQAIAEIGRCLRPGGTLTLLTFRSSEDPIYRYFQDTFRGPGFPDGGMPLFRPEDIRNWLDQAGLSVRAESLPGNFIFITAVRT